MEKGAHHNHENKRVTGKDIGCLGAVGASLIVVLTAVDTISHNEALIDKIFTYGLPIGGALFLTLLAYGGYKTRT